MVDAVLLEWEGVLADTRHARQDALRAALAEEGVPSGVLADEESCRGLGVHAAVTAALQAADRSDPTLADLVALRAGRAFVADLGRGFILTPGAAAFIARAQQRARVVIVTRAARAETDLILNLAGLATAVSAVVCADDVLGDTPSVALYTQALSHLARRRPVDPSRVIAIVDALPAIRAARAAGLHVLAVNAPAHEALDADGTVDSLDLLTMDDVARLVTPAHPERPA